MRRLRVPRLRAAVIAASLVVSILVAGVAHAPDATADTSFTLAGGGWGHGVGMSQYGALGMAQAGFDATAITQHYYTGSTPGVTAQPGNIRVRLLSATSGFTVTGSGPVGFYVNGVQYGESQAGAAVSVVANGTTIRINSTDLPPGDLKIGYNGSPIFVPATGHHYRDGVLSVSLYAAFTMQLVVENLDMERYLYGLGEVPSSWPSAALQAQALAGRSYAKTSIDSRRAANPQRTWDIDAGTVDQVYLGDDKATAAFGAQWIAAVDATSSQVITYSSSVVQAFYSSSSGGYTENSEYVFTTALPYLRGVDDPYDGVSANPNFRWQRTYSGSELQSWYASTSGVDLGPVSSLSFSGNFGVSGRIDRATVTLTGPNGTRSMTGNAFKSMVNQFAGSRQLLSTRLLLSPFGSYDGIARDPGGARVRGWAIDPKTTSSIDIHIYVDGAIALVASANVNRPDVGAAYGYGDAHGFDTHIDLGNGTHDVCVYAINSGTAGTNTPLGCRRIQIDNNPLGTVDSVRQVPGGISATGWALDPDTVDAINVHAYIDGVWAGQATASDSRPDVGAVYPAWGAGHGYSFGLPANEGTHQVCIYAINVGSGSANPQLGCRNVVVRANPFGTIDGATRTAGKATIRGWAVDPDTASSIKVHVYVDGTWGGAFDAAATRNDIAAALPGYGANHGFSLDVGVPAGSHTVCVYGINSGPGTNAALGCIVPDGGLPIGNTEGIDPGTGNTIKGWALDPDVATPITVHVWIDGSTWGGAYTADLSRPDVAATYPTYGDKHGFQVPLPTGSHTTCVWAINTNGPNVNVGCVST